MPVRLSAFPKCYLEQIAGDRTMSVFEWIDMARNLGLNVTAEGVEHEATCDALRAMGCDVGQGYFFSRPLAIDALTGWLRETRWRSAN